MQHLDAHPPDLALRHHLLALHVGADEGGEVAALCELGDEEECAGGLVVGDVFEGQDVWVGDGGQDSHFVEGVGYLAVVGVGYLYFLHRVDAAVLFSFDFVDGGEGALAHFGDHFEVLHFVN